MSIPLALLAVVTTASAEPRTDWPAPDPEPVAVMDGLSIDELSRSDARGTATAVAILAATIAELPREDRAAATESLQFLVVSCPFTRAAMQLPFALHDVAAELDPADFERVVASDLQHIQSGLATHAALLEDLGVDLAVPGTADALGTAEPSLFVDRDALALAGDPLVVTGALVDALPRLARSIDAPTLDAIEYHSDRLEALTGIGRPCPRGPWTLLPGQPWTLGMQLAGWGDAFTRIAPFATDPDTQARVEQVVELLDAHGRAGFVGRFERGPL